MTQPKTQAAQPAGLHLEVVPPTVRQGEAGIEAALAKIATVHEAIGLDGVNIPEIREESAKSDKGERRQPFEERIEPRWLAWRIQEALSIECMINRVVVHLSRERQADWLRETWEEYGVRRFVLVGGEKSGADYPGPSVPEANELVRRVITAPGLRVGNICIPTRRGEAARMRRKMATGTDFFTTQIVYHADEFTELLAALAKDEGRGRAPEMLVTVCPVKSIRNIRFLHWLGVSISPELEAWLTSDPDAVTQRSVEHILAVWSEISAYRRRYTPSFPVGVSLAPIGNIPHETTIRLAEGIAGSDQVTEAVRSHG